MPALAQPTGGEPTFVKRWMRQDTTEPRANPAKGAAERAATTDRFAPVMRVAPGAFVLLWSSGFVVARLVRPFTDPASFLATRFALAAVLLSVIAWLAGATWPQTVRGWRDSLVAGALLQGLYILCAFVAVKHGLPAALASLICSLQPLLTAALAGPLLGEAVGLKRWAGIAVGFGGAALVLAPGLLHYDTAHAGTVPIFAVLVCIVAMLSITSGTLWQKRTGADGDLLAGAAIQAIGALLSTLPFALAFEHGVANHPQVWLGLAWSVIMMSGLTMLLLLAMIKQGAVAKVTSLFFLVPAVTALMTFALFGEALGAVQVIGMAVATVGVFLAR